MRFLDQLGKAAAQAADRARFEAEKFHRTSRIQGELTDLRQQLDAKLIAMGQRAYDLSRAGQMSPASFTDLTRQVDQLRIDIIKKEDELRSAQAEQYVEPEPDMLPTAQHVPIQDHPAAPQPPQGQPPRQPQQPAYQQPAPSQPVQPGQPGQPPVQPGQPGRVPTLFQNQPGKKTCPACSFQMPVHAIFCPNCGFRVGD